MALVTADEGEVQMLTWVFANSTIMHLFTNDVTPAAGSTVATFTEATDGNYEEKTLTGDNWSISTVSNVGTAEYAQQTFSFGGTATVYGYYVTDSAGTTLLWAERFSAAASFGASGGTINVTPKFTGDSAT